MQKNGMYIIMWDLCDYHMFSLKTSMFKWNPDYDNAANHFDKAGIATPTIN